MKIKRMIFLLVIFSFIFVSVSRPFALETNINNTTNNLIEEIKKHIEKSNFKNNVHPNIILEKSILFYKSKLSNCKNINGINVL